MWLFFFLEEFQRIHQQQCGDFVSGSENYIFSSCFNAMPGFQTTWFLGWTLRQHSSFPVHLGGCVKPSGDPCDWPIHTPLVFFWRKSSWVHLWWHICWKANQSHLSTSTVATWIGLSRGVRGVSQGPLEYYCSFLHRCCVLLGLCLMITNPFEFWHSETLRHPSYLLSIQALGGRYTFPSSSSLPPFIRALVLQMSLSIAVTQHGDMLQCGCPDIAPPPPSLVCVCVCCMCGSSHNHRTGRGTTDHWIFASALQEPCQGIFQLY